jgi:hypothetical protein
MNDKDREGLVHGGLGNISVFQYNDELSEYQAIPVDDKVPLSDVLDSEFIFLFVDRKRCRVWIWFGKNTTTRMKFVSTRFAPRIRDRHGMGFRIIAVDEGKEPVGFEIMIGLVEEEISSIDQIDPLYEGTKDDQELLESLREEKELLLKEFHRNKLVEKVWKKIDSTMKKESIEEITLERQYLPEIFDDEVLELSKDDGLPTFKPFILPELGLNGIITKLYGKVLKLEKAEIIPKHFREIMRNLEVIDKKKEPYFKKLYAEAMIREGNIHFNKQEFENAAKQYEKAGEWSSKKLLDKEMINRAFGLAINSWISACKFEEAIRVLEKIPKEEKQNALKYYSEKVKAMGKYLLKAKRYDLVIEQLSIAIITYQSKALLEDVKSLTDLLTEALIQIFKIQVKAKEIYAAKYTYDEIENMWDTYNVKKTNLDSSLKKLITFFMKKNIFRISATLIDKLNSSSLKRDLAKMSIELEEKYKDSIQEEIAEEIKKGEDLLKEYAKAELDYEK